MFGLFYQLKKTIVTNTNASDKRQRHVTKSKDLGSNGKALVQGLVVLAAYWYQLIGMLQVQFIALGVAAYFGYKI